MSVTGTVDPLPALEYSKDGSTWTTFEIGTTTVELADGEKVYFRGDNSSFSPSLMFTDYIKFTMTGKIAASGNIMSLVDKTCASKIIPNECCFYCLFEECTSLTTAPDLPATTLTDYCYAGMFNGCTALVSAPVLPATTLAQYCYSNMFSNCTALTTGPELPATSLVNRCYYSMFRNCSALTSIKVHFTDWNTGANSTQNWVDGVSATGKFYYKTGSLLDVSTKDNNHVPTGFTPEEF